MAVWHRSHSLLDVDDGFRYLPHQEPGRGKDEPAALGPENETSSLLCQVCFKHVPIVVQGDACWAGSCAAHQRPVRQRWIQPGFLNAMDVHVCD